MRVLFLPIPAIGHAYPMVPLAWALRAAGHEVLFGTAFGGLAVEKAGLPVVEVELGQDRPEVLAKLAGKLAETNPGLHAKLRERGDTGLDSLEEAVPFFAEKSAAFTGVLVDLARTWRPDLVVHSPLYGGALVAAAVLGVPSVECREGFGRTECLAVLMYEHMKEVFADYGATGLPERRTGTDSSPPSMIEGSPGGWPMRHVPYSGGARLPAWLMPPVVTPERPRVGLSLGSGSGTWRLEMAASILAAAADLDIELVLALGDVDIDALGAIPPNTRIPGWVPLSALVRTCTALIHHGGGGTTLTALEAGVPQLVLATGADNGINARAVHNRGAGISAKIEEVDTALLRRLITDDALHSTARQVRTEISTMPAPAEIVPRLVSLCGP
ncbi:nucleotide disphospho-sugar-binding domain-containing protein [Amycolatopsis pigmentata]|uniref:Nucleotide disphospho-sugar-binding domain-containing protein n=1 Tax=Amycolatopsis pigmentata TaxID=450801 RepID=A0ABW5FL33_9PSEU